MVAHPSAAPPTPWSKDLAQPKIHETAYVHSFSNIIGNVYIGANVMVSPGTSIRADEGSPFYVGDGSNVQDGVVIHGLAQGRVMGDDQQQYSVWIGKNTSITHMALVHGPAYVGDDCFIGFRSTVFNARVGKGCVIMMHVLIQDVEIPPGRYVPSGSVITTQQQADRLPNVQSVDIQFASQVVGVNDALRSGYHCAENIACIATIRNELEQVYESKVYESKVHEPKIHEPKIHEPNSVDDFDRQSNSNSHHQGQSNMGSDVIEQVRHLLAQGYRIGTEHADKRRFQTGAWQNCAPIQTTREGEVMAALETCLAEHGGEYVRLFGIDTQSKRRVSELIIQRPGDTPSVNSVYTRNEAPSYSSGGRATQTSSSSSGGLSSEAIAQVRQLLGQGYRIAAEYADTRRFQTGAWQSCAPIQTTHEGEVMAALETCLAENSGKYVRLYGIDTQSKRRIAETTIQRPGSNGGSTGAAPASSGTTPSSRSATYSNSNSAHSNSAHSAQSSLGSETIEQVKKLLSQGYRIGTEHADKRRFQSGAWQTCSPIAASRESEVISALESCLSEHRGEYVRLFGIDTKLKQRVSDLIVQRP